MNRLLVVGLLAVACFAGVSATKATPSKCEVCQDLVTAAELFVKFKGWNATELLAGADKICSVLANFETECTAIINSGGLPFATCIANGGNTTECCQDIPAVNFCGARKNSDRITVQKPKITECQVCQDFVEVAELFVKFEGWNATTILAEADKLCGFLGTAASTCTALVNAGGMAFATCITGGSSNATACCQAIPALHVCSSKVVVPSARISVVKPKVTECQVCTDFVEVAELFVKFEGWNATTILAEADKLCSFLGSLSTTCKSIVDAGGMAFATCITGGSSNATTCCQAIPALHICSSKAVVPSPRIAVVKPKLTECQVCVDFVDVAELFVKYEGWNATTIVAEADKLCAFLPSQYTTECKTIIALGGMQFANCITAPNSNATQCCQGIPLAHICTDAAVVLATAPLSVPPKQVTPCQVCTDAVTVAELFIKFEGWNATQILDEADKLCSILGSFATECETIINAGGLNFTTCIASGGNAQQCCQAIPALHVCSSAPAAVVVPAAPKATLCEVCQDIIVVSELFVKFEGWNATTLLAEADKICSMLGSLSTECQAIINAGGMNFATCITTGGNGTACCSAIPGLHICSSADAPKQPKDQECVVCQDIVQIAELLVKFEGWNATQIISEADVICGFLGQYASECKTIIQAGGANLAQCIASGSNTTQCCQQIPGLNICSSATARISRLEVVKPKLSECQVCTDVATVAELFVKFEGWNATQILAEASVLCGYLPSQYASVCKSIIAIGGTPFATCIATSGNATTCCSQIPDLHICTSAKREVTNCQICQDAVVAAELFVKFEGWNATQLLANVGKICQFAGALSSECETIVNAGGLGLAECITSNTNTTQCCQEIPALNLCNSAAPATTPTVVPVNKQAFRPVSGKHPIRMKLN